MTYVTEYEIKDGKMVVKKKEEKQTQKSAAEKKEERPYGDKNKEA